MFKNWKTGGVNVLPGGLAIVAVVTLRWFGGLQGIELAMFDRLLRWQPPEPKDERILIVGINEQDIQKIGTYPVPDRELANIIQLLQRSKPAVIGLDIFRDQPVPNSAKELNSLFQTQKNLIGIEKRVAGNNDVSVKPPPALPPEQIGFVDASFDLDGSLRRSLLFTADEQGNIYPSLSILLAETYLERQGIPIQEGLMNRDSIRIGTVEIPLIQGRVGGYHQAESGGLVSLIRWRSNSKPFSIVSLSDVKSGRVKPDQIRNKVILIGSTSPSVRDFVTSQAIESVNPALIYGVEAQAHAVSQLISAGENGRSLIQVWPLPLDYLWIVLWGILGIVLGWVVRSPGKWFLGIGIGVVGILGVGYGGLILAWWIPVVPPLMTFLINGAGLTAFYRYDQSLRSRLQARQLVIDETFNAIHNGPLQVLAMLRRSSKDDQITRDELLQQLDFLDLSIRGIYDAMLREGVQEAVYVSEDLRVNLQEPLHEVLQQVYGDVLSRDLPYFAGLKVKVVNFEPFEEKRLTPELKRGLCRFLEEALCNVGKHAIGVKRLEVFCGMENGRQVVRVVDNGTGELSESEGMGTQQARKLAKRLRGEFVRSYKLKNNMKKGVICELVWPLNSLRPRS